MGRVGDSGDLVAVVLNARISRKEQGALLDALFERDEAMQEVERMKARLNQADARALRNWCGYQRAAGSGIDWQNVGRVILAGGAMVTGFFFVSMVAVVVFYAAAECLIGG